MCRSYLSQQISVHTHRSRKSSPNTFRLSFLLLYSTKISCILHTVCLSETEIVSNEHNFLALLTNRCITLQVVPFTAVKRQTCLFTLWTSVEGNPVTAKKSSPRCIFRPSFIIVHCAEQPKQTHRPKFHSWS